MEVKLYKLFHSQAWAEGVNMLGARTIKKQDGSISTSQPILILRFCRGGVSSRGDFPNGLRLYN